MKTTTSLPPDLVEVADCLAHRLGISRSQLFAAALREYLAAHAHERLLDRNNRVCTKIDTSVDPSLQQAHVNLLRRDEW